MFRYFIFIFSLVLLSCNHTNTEARIEAQDSIIPQIKPSKAEVKIDTIRHSPKSIQEAMDLFKSLNYTHDSWVAGIREIPSLYIMTIPESWREQTTKEISTQLKKEIFFRVIAPLALHANDLIMTDRKRIIELKADSLHWSNNDETWLVNMAADYKMETPNNPKNESVLNELLKRVDAIPLSLILAQSAEESGWGTSRFAAEGNALFGQWAWGEETMKPLEQRPGMGNYGLARFNSPQESMIAYIHNLNSHQAYENLRQKRFEIEQKGELVSGWELAKTLDHYSERGEEYVKSIHAMMKYNHLEQTDSAFLNRNPVILIIPNRP